MARIVLALGKSGLAKLGAIDRFVVHPHAALEMRAVVKVMLGGTLGDFEWPY